MQPQPGRIGTLDDTIDAVEIAALADQIGDHRQHRRIHDRLLECAVGVEDVAVIFGAAEEALQVAVRIPGDEIRRDAPRLLRHLQDDVAHPGYTVRRADLLRREHRVAERIEFPGVLLEIEVANGAENAVRSAPVIGRWGGIAGIEILRHGGHGTCVHSSDLPGHAASDFAAASS